MTAPLSHPGCWQDDHYEHVDCRRPSGRACVDCGAPAGTAWGPYWCPDCDVRRLDRITEGFERIDALLGGTDRARRRTREQEAS